MQGMQRNQNIKSLHICHSLKQVCVAVTNPVRSPVGSIVKQLEDAKRFSVVIGHCLFSGGRIPQMELLCFNRIRVQECAATKFDGQGEGLDSKKGSHGGPSDAGWHLTSGQA